MIRIIGDISELRKISPLKAYTDSGKKWKYFPKLYKSTIIGGIVLSINSPIEYELYEDFVDAIKKHPRLTIDIAGRNHGVKESVYIDCSDIIRWLKEASHLCPELKQIGIC